MTTEQYSIGYDAGYQDGFDAALAEPVKQEPIRDMASAWFKKCCQLQDELNALKQAQPVKQEPVACPNLQPVINWLENGCDPKEAAKELRIYQDKMKAAPVQPVKQEPVAWVSNESVQKLRECGWSDEAIATVVPTINLDVPVDAKAIREQALEEAAKVFEANGANMMTKDECAAGIRGLK